LFVKLKKKGLPQTESEKQTLLFQRNNIHLIYLLILLRSLLNRKQMVKSEKKKEKLISKNNFNPTSSGIAMITQSPTNTENYNQSWIFHLSFNQQIIIQ